MAALIAGAIGWFTFAGAPFMGRIVLQTRSNDPIATPASGTDDDRVRTQVELLRSRSFFERLVTESSVATLPTISNHADPVRFLEENVQIRIVERDRIEISLMGDREADLAAILNAIARRHIQEAAETDRRSREEALFDLGRMRKLRDDVHAAERAIELTVAENAVAGHAEELGRMNSTLQEAEREIEKLNNQIARAKSPEEIEPLRVRREVAAGLAIARRKSRDQFETEHWSAKRARTNAERLDDEQREDEDGLERQIVAIQLDASVVIREPAVAIRNDNLRPRVLRGSAFFGAAFVGAFLLGFGLFRAGVK